MAAPRSSIELAGAITLQDSRDTLTLFGNEENYLAFPSVGSLWRFARQSAGFRSLAGRLIARPEQQFRLTILLGGRPVASVRFSCGRRQVQPTLARLLSQKIPVPTV